jgi:formyl-CoA transferase
MVGQALSGLAHTTLDPDTLQVTGTNTSDSITGLTAAMSIMAALVSRSSHGRGTRLDVDMLSSSLSFLGAEAQIVLDTGVTPQATTRPANSLSFAMRCADGELLGLHLSSVPKFWEGLTDVLERAELRADPRFGSRPERARNYQALRAELQREFLRRPRADWLDALIAADVPAAPINTLAEAVVDPQVHHLGLIETISHPVLGESTTVGPPHRFSRYPAGALLHPPRLGEHTDDIVASLLGSGEDASRYAHVTRASEEASA